MSLRDTLFDYYKSSSLPSYDDLINLIEQCGALLENEDPSYRPREKNGEHYSGGLLSFLDNHEKPVIVVPDLHARAYFLWNILEYKISINSIEISILEALEQKLIYVICVGDIFHSEMRSFERWKKAFAHYKNGNILSKEMSDEVLENLNLLQMIMTLKLNCPQNFHCLKGNHENILNEEGRGNHAFYKMAAEGEMFYRFMAEKYDDALIYLLSCFEHSLPLCAVFPNLVVSHAEPAFTLNKSKIINYRENPDVVLALTWTGNNQSETGSVSKSIKNLIGKNLRMVLWLGGHRPVSGRYFKRQRGKYIQIHNPDEQNIALVQPDVKFNPETNIVSVV